MKNELIISLLLLGGMAKSLIARPLACLMYYPTLPNQILPYTTLPAPYATLPYHTLPSPGALIIYPSLAYPTLPRDEESKEKRKKPAYLSFPTPSHPSLPYPSLSRYSDHMYYPTYPSLPYPLPYPAPFPTLPN